MIPNNNTKANKTSNFSRNTSDIYKIQEKEASSFVFADYFVLFLFLRST